MNTLHSLMAGILMLLALMTATVTALATLDTTPPTTSATLTGTKGSDGWYKTSVTVTLTTADGADGSGVAKTEYSLDNMTWQTYSAPFVLDKDGDKYVYFRSIDLAGNIEAPAKSQDIKINKSGLVGLWHMDNNWHDASVIGNNGTAYNGVTFSTNPKVGTYSGSFNGVNNYLGMGAPSTLVVTNAITISAWIYPTGPGSLSTYGGIIVNKEGEYEITRFSDGSIQFAIANTSPGWNWINTNYRAPQNTWTHFALTYSASDSRIYAYANGLLVYQGVGTGNIMDIDTTNNDFRIGGRQVQSQYFQGLIDEVAIYNRALSATEIQGFYRDYVVNTPTVNPVLSPTATANITLSGTKSANTAIMVNGNTLVPLDGTTSWRANYSLSQEMNTISITALDSQNFKSLPVTLTVVLDVTPPVAPTIDPVSAPINTTSKTITGTRSSDSATVTVNCTGATIGTVSYPTATTWNANISGLTEGNNTITAYASDTAGNPSATTTATITVDTNPPTVSATPDGGIYNSAQSIALASSEQAVIYYTMDGSTPTASATKYSQPVSIPVSAILKYFTSDLAGNNCDIITANYVIDTAPPALAISTLSDGAYTNNEILNIAGTVTDNTGVTGITVNDIAVQVNADGSFSHALLLKKGINIIPIAATDRAGNMAADTRIVNLDQTAPVLAVTTPADNSKTAKMLLELSGTVDETSVVTVKMKDFVQSALMNNGAFTSTIILEPGYNTIEITATDLAGNQSSLKRTVVFDDQVPSLAVTGPSQDIRTNQSSLTINGTVSDSLTAVGVTISMDNELLTLPVIDGTFEQTVNFAEEKTYDIIVTATNEVGTATSVQRNVIYDITPPVLSIDQVPGQTSQPSLSVSGTREAGTTVTVTCTTASLGEVSYPTSTTWLVDISGLREGENVIAAASVDAAGNEVMATTKVVLAYRLPQITITATPDVIWPPNHKMVPVTIAGGVETYGSDIKSVSISVSDEYGKFKYNNLTFGSTVMLEAWRNGNDKDGRIYTITVVVTNWGGIKTAKTAIVTVRSPQKTLSSGYRFKAKTRH